jgi:hypothetical protein
MDFAAFASAHPATRELVQNWFEHARYEVREHRYSSFEPFIRLWISFNAWAARVTGAEYDAAMVKALANSREMNEAFSKLRMESRRFRDNVMRFASFWPIFSVVSIRKHGFYESLHEDRRADIERLLAAGVRRGPEGFYDRDDPTWKMCIQAIYIVRCNLFHGAKGDAADDVEIVDAAYRTLLGFIEGTDLYGWRER